MRRSTVRFFFKVTAIISYGRLKLGVDQKISNLGKNKKSRFFEKFVKKLKKNDFFSKKYQNVSKM